MGKTSFCRLLSHCKFCGDYKSTEVIEASQAISVESNTNQNITVEQYFEIFKIYYRPTKVSLVFFETLKLALLIWK